MAKSSIHIEAGKLGFFAHNSRESKTVNAIFSDEKNYCSCTKDEAFKIFRHELEKRSAKYTERTGQKLQKRAITHLSAIVNFNKEHTPNDIKKVCDYLEKVFDTKIIQFAMHRDEGHVKDYEEIKNYHAHIEFMGLDSEGNSVRKKFTKKSLIELQSAVASMLNMERGHNYTQEKMKRPKRLGTYEYKKAKQDEEKVVLQEKNKIRKTANEIIQKKLITIKELQKANNEFREKLKEHEAKREHYSKLEQWNRELKEQLKNKTLDNERLNIEIQRLNAELFEPGWTYPDGSTATTKDVLKTVIREKEQLQEDKNGMQKLFEDTNIELEKAKKAIEELREIGQKYEKLVDSILPKDKMIKELKAKNEQLERENRELKEELNNYIQIQREIEKEQFEKIAKDFLNKKTEHKPVFQFSKEEEKREDEEVAHDYYQGYGLNM